jgi:hypothetical protein
MYWKSFVEHPSPAPAVSTVSNLPKASASPSAVAYPDAGQRSAGTLVQSGLWSDLQAEPKKSAEDELLDQAIQIVRDNERASVSLLQRKLRIGYSRAARLMELLEQKGYLGEDEGPTKGRAVLDTPYSTPPAQSSQRSTPRPAPGSSDLSSSPRSTRPSSNSGIIRPSGGSGTSGDSSSREERKFEEDDLGSFDDWTDEDWADLDKG